MSTFYSIIFGLTFIVGNVLSTGAQDIIVNQNAQETEATVTEITSRKITCRKWNNPEDSVYTQPLNEVSFIKIGNGTEQAFSIDSTTAKNVSASRKINFQGNIELGVIFGADFGGPSLDVAMGTSIGNHFFIGLQTGMRSMIKVRRKTKSDYWETGEDKTTNTTIFESYIPFGVDIRGYIPVAENIRAYLDCSLGGFFGSSNGDMRNGFACQVGAGIEINRSSLSIGYNAQVRHGIQSTGFFKFGMRLGK